MNLSRRYLNTVAVFAVVLAVTATWSGAASASSSTFKNPGAVALDHDGHLWVANSDYFGVTEIEARTGKVIRVINDKADGFIDPSGIAVDANNVWIVSGGVTYRNGTSHVGTVTELNATTGALIRTVSLKDHGITGLAAVSVDTKDVWIVADGGSRIAELSNATGEVVRIRRGRNRDDVSSGMAIGGGHLWVPSPNISDGIVERNAVTGQKVRTITPIFIETPPGGGPAGPTYLGPQYVAVDSHYVWSANEGSVTYKLNGGSVTQINAATGKIVRTIDTAADRFSGNITAITSDGTHVWIVNGSETVRNQRRGDTLTELNATDGSLVRVIRLHQGIYSDPVAVVANGIDVWVSDEGGGTAGTGCVIELSAVTGRVVRIIGD
jgi:hypothetical protein